MGVTVQRKTNFSERKQNEIINIFYVPTPTPNKRIDHKMDFSEDADADDENMDPDVSEDQRPFLERLRHLDGEHSDNSIRLNFGPNQTLTSDNIKTTVKPPPGFSFSQKQDGDKENQQQTGKFSIGQGFQLTSGSGLLSFNTSGKLPNPSQSCQGLSLKSLESSSSSSSAGSKPSLGMLASSHLSSSNNKYTPLLPSASRTLESKPSLTMLASSHLSSVDLGGPKPSLGMLASSHLSSSAASSSAGLKFGNLPSLFSSSDSKPSLHSLASSHLNSSSSLSISSLPDASVTVGSMIRSKSPDQPEIDLLSALKLNSSDSKDSDSYLKVNHVLDDNVKIPLTEESLDIDIFVTHLTFSKVKSILRRKTKSPFSVAITRKWTRRVPRLKTNVFCEKYSKSDIFMFDTPSPDDVVLQAQQQSRAFNKLTIT